MTDDEQDESMVVAVPGAEIHIKDEATARAAVEILLGAVEGYIGTPMLIHSDVPLVPGEQVEVASETGDTATEEQSPTDPETVETSDAVETGETDDGAPDREETADGGDAYLPDGEDEPDEQEGVELGEDGLVRIDGEPQVRGAHGHEDPKWCGICGYGPATEKGVRVHDGRSHPDADPVIRDSEPGEDDLVSPDGDGDPSGPVEPPDDDDFVEDEYGINESEIQPVDTSDFGHLYTTGNMAAIISRCDGFYEIGDELGVSRSEAHRICSRIGVDDRIASGRDIEESEVRQRLKIATEKHVQNKKATANGGD